jgi:two-component system, cell cycle response regulator
MRILVADDDAVTRRLLQARLAGWGYEVVAVADGGAAWRALQEADAPRLAVLDWEMPELDGPELCRRVRAAGAEPYVYLILLTARDRGADLVTGLAAGADDFIAKPFAPQELQGRLRVGRRILDMAAELVAAREAMTLRATRDALTGLLNRGTIVEFLGRELARADREGQPLGVMMADLDHFKRVNDTHGHLAGDAVLREAARRILAGRRVYDLVGRYGGEELLLLAPGCDLEAAASVAERLRAAIGDRPIDTAEGPIAITASWGVTTYTPGSGLDPEAVIKAADGALYAAKRAGRDRVCRASVLAVGPRTSSEVCALQRSHSAAVAVVVHEHETPAGHP